MTRWIPFSIQNLPIHSGKFPVIKLLPVIRIPAMMDGINYGDGSSSSGYIASEYFFFTTQNEKPFFFSMKFGCSSDSRGLFERKTAGILGMNMDPISFMGQLGKQYFSNKFSYCLVDPNTVTHSYLKFGDDAYNGRPAREF
ncbi:hypothetical protein LWI28_023698 [Acer negundo]|uniref:Xylanase inhibitor N-terminal domain-containing protein n=1 Tax=Acer negundo TaxID=4023 RepID=A0AAD5J7M0_ACENE|nr:hypothetical protein LWI28_023698 [Acer negundo]KAK4851732.1 hypothetical protein QYF36_017929 [Acer negundo]